MGQSEGCHCFVGQSSYSKVGVCVLAGTHMRLDIVEILYRAVKQFPLGVRLDNVPWSAQLSHAGASIGLCDNESSGARFHVASGRSIQ